jgi:predicted NBD/HSP70 family sugar kinase
MNPTNLAIQKNNRSTVYKLLMNDGALSRQEIVARTGLSLPTVVGNLTDLENEGLLGVTDETGRHTGGRPTRKYSFQKNARAAIGLDISRDYVVAVVVNLAGEVVGKLRSHIRFERSDEYYRRLGAIVRRLVRKGGLRKKDILGVGIGVPGLVTPDKQTVFYGEILKFTGATCAEFAQYLPYNAAMFNDASAAGFGEFWIRGRKPGNACYISLSNNIGGAVMIDNNIVSGRHFHSGEVGHMKIHPDGRECYCGQKGCVDPYLAATTLSRLANEDLAGFFRLAASKEAKASEAWDAYLDDLALTVNNVQELFDCTVILGGYVSRYISPWMDELRRRAAALNSFERDAGYIDICHYKTLSIAVGAALDYVSSFIQSV